MGGHLTTKCRHLFFSSGFILLLFFFLIQSARAQETGTVITKSGDKYENVVIKMHRTLSIISVERDTLKNIINFEEIVKILDADGSDITAEIKKWHSSGVKGIWKAEGDWISIQRRKQLWKTGLRLATNLSLPVSNNHAGITPGVGYEGTACFSIFNGFAIRASISKLKLRDDLKTTDTLYDPFTYGLGLVYRIPAFRFAATGYRIGVQYYKPPSAMSSRNAIPYLYTEFGIISSKTISKLWRYEDGEKPYWDEIHKETRFVINQGGGLILLISEKFGLDFGVEYNIVFGNESLVNYGSILDFKLGLITFL